MQPANPPAKLSLDQFRAGMSVFLNFDAVEETIAARLNELAAVAATATEAGGDTPAERLLSWLSVNTGRAFEERLKIVVALTNGSLENLKRVHLHRFPHQSWGSVHQDTPRLAALCAFIVNPSRQTDIPRYMRSKFGLPDNWASRLNPEQNDLAWLFSDTLQSLYSVQTGFALEQAVARVVTDAGYHYEKGSVYIVNNKEVDLAIPNRAIPLMLIMSSYSVTTSSAQTLRANEQKGMYEDVRRHNQNRANADQPNVQFVNVVDGGGWLERGRDLRELYAHCDYALSYSQLEQLPAILDYHCR